MRPLLKSQRTVNWHIAAAEDSSTSEILDKLSSFLTEHKVQRTRTKPKCPNKDRARLRANRKKDGKGVDESVSVKNKDGNQNKEELKRDKVSLTKDWPVCLGLRSVLRELDKDDHLSMAVVDADALLPSAVGQFIGLFAASCKIPVYAVRGLNERLAKELNLNSLHAVGIRKLESCQSIVATAAELLTPVSVANADASANDKKETPSDRRKRKFTPANLVTPVASSNKKRKRKKRKNDCE
uniref:Ribosomal protein L7Ae/L30e/S12e/Gadd45 domain-containing protein n=1 Tax=Plectus sambesii TaxID=2011161 RepID=A0A914UVW5_9BILA